MCTDGWHVPFLCQTLHEFANLPRIWSPWPKAHYQQQRAPGSCSPCGRSRLGFQVDSHPLALGLQAA